MAQAMRRCSICGTLFPAGRRNRKTCSDECRVKLAVMHDKERQLQIGLAAAVKAAGGVTPEKKISASVVPKENLLKLIKELSK